MMKIQVKVKPNVKTSGIEILSISPAVLKIKTQKPAQDGLANKDIIKQLSEFFNSPRKNITIIQGLFSSTKCIQIDWNKNDLEEFLKVKGGFLL